MLQNEDLRLYQAISSKVFQARQGGSLIRKAERIHGRPRKLKQPAKKAEATVRLMADNIVQKAQTTNRHLACPPLEAVRKSIILNVILSETKDLLAKGPHYTHHTSSWNEVKDLLAKDRFYVDSSVKSLRMTFFGRPLWRDLPTKRTFSDGRIEKLGS